MPTPSTREIHIEFDQRVPMRDGITLSADIYRPMIYRIPQKNIQ